MGDSGGTGMVAGGHGRAHTGRAKYAVTTRSNSALGAKWGDFFFAIWGVCAVACELRERCLSG